MLGKDMLCAPVLEEGKTERKVRIPDGEWRDVNGKLYQPGTYRISAPLGTIPVFFREGSDIPDLDKICRLMKGEMR
jgi:alpha-glucosidase (family GH31 glycosyl hydrolase)